MTPENLARLHAACFVWPRPWSAEEFSKLLAQDTVLLSASEDQAFALARIAADEMELLTIATHPDHLRKGLATSCLLEVERQATVRGAKQAFLEVAAPNKAAIALYHSASYEMTGLRRGYYQSTQDGPLDALIFTKSLA